LTKRGLRSRHEQAQAARALARQDLRGPGAPLMYDIAALAIAAACFAFGFALIWLLARI
jgi:hypothetical protein